MAPQFPALRTAVKQLHGGAGRAAVTPTAGYPWRGEHDLGNFGDPKGNAIMATMVFVIDTQKRPLSHAIPHVRGGC